MKTFTLMFMRTYDVEVEAETLEEAEEKARNMILNGLVHGPLDFQGEVSDDET